MEFEYHVNSTSRDSAVVQDIVLSDQGNAEEAQTRKILRPLLVNNKRTEDASVKIEIVHQKRHARNEPWQDVDAFDLRTLRAGQEVRLSLSAGQTYQLYRALRNLYALTQNGIPQGEHDLVVVSASELMIQGKAKEVIEYLSGQDQEEILNAIEALKPNLLEAVAVKKQHDTRRAALETFEKQLQTKEWSEPQWQKFFEDNTWIFGHGLAYQFLNTITAQPNYGGTTVYGRGGQRGDFLMATEADVRFTVLVEIKTPDSPLLESKMYRNKVYQVGHELVGGVSQLQSNSRTWVLEGARQEDNREILDEQGIYTYGPKGILVIGQTKQLANHNQRTTFELFRRNLVIPEVITFDELLARAKFLVSHDVPQSETGTGEGNHTDESN